MQKPRVCICLALTIVVSSCLIESFALADSTKKPVPKRLLLIGQGWDGGHPPGTHEYLAGVKILGRLLRNEQDLEIIPVSADGAWSDGPELLARADAAVIYVAEGAKWLSADNSRLAAFQNLAKRSGGLLALHWATGTKNSEPIEPFVKLFGACHGGPDRKYKVLETTPEWSAKPHPILSGLKPFSDPIHEEFYFALKMAGSDGASVVLDPTRSAIQPLLKISLDGNSYPVSWAWQRPDGGRSFGFTGLHFHENWKHDSYRRLIAQATLWILNREIPDSGINVEVNSADLELPK